MVLDLGLAVLNFTNWGELGQRGSVGFLDQEASIPLWHPDSPFPSLVLTRLRQISAPPLAQTFNQNLKYYRVFFLPVPPKKCRRWQFPNKKVQVQVETCHFLRDTPLLSLCWLGFCHLQHLELLGRNQSKNHPVLYCMIYTIDF